MYYTVSWSTAASTFSATVRVHIWEQQFDGTWGTSPVNTSYFNAGTSANSGTWPTPPNKERYTGTTGKRYKVTSDIVRNGAITLSNVLGNEVTAP